MSPLHEKKYSTADAAKALGVSKKTLLKWCKEKRISYVRYPSGAFKFRESVLEVFMGRNSVPATNAPPQMFLKKAA
jgi:excisionase family DNA binding protein